MKSRRIHVMGPSGAGVSTLGRALAGTLAVPHHDTDDYYWRPTAQPYREQRPVADRLRLMEEMFLGRPGWVLSGSFESWGDSILPLLDLVVYLRAPVEIRLARLRDRETRRYGIDAVSPGGCRHQETEEFIEWASHYDDGSREGRSLARHEAWLERVTCRILRADGARELDDLVGDIVRALAETS